MDEASAAECWENDRTTFQRVYDLIVGTTAFLSAREFGERANCSETGAREALEQLAEMGIARKRDGRPATYRRNDAYFEWKRIDSLAREHEAEQLRSRLDDLAGADEQFQEQFGAPDPDAVSTTDLSIEEHSAFEERWDDLREWRTVRRDIRILRRAVDQAEMHADGMQA